MQLARKIRKTWAPTINPKDKKARKKLIIAVKDMYKKVVGTTMAQMNKLNKHPQMLMNQSIRKHGTRAMESILKEYS